jgi:hypothetical protein
MFRSVYLINPPSLFAKETTIRRASKFPRKTPLLPTASDVPTTEASSSTVSAGLSCTGEFAIQIISSSEPG